MDDFEVDFIIGGFPCQVILMREDGVLYKM